MRSNWLLISLIAAGIVAALSPPTRAQPVLQPVATKSGNIQGVAESDVLAFKGIPYAAPPVGDGRWREPAAAAPWQGTRDAKVYGNACIQPPGLSEANGGPPGPLSEDCLYLNVWTPALRQAAALPVMVWIHGGAFIFGSGSLPLYSGAPLASRGAVVVTINYRLGQLGFFAHPALEKQRPGGPVNFGLLDQIAALKWVQQNIAAFGGDPGNVTILGQSAGAKSVLALFASPLARGLFRKGIAQSSYAVPDATRAKAVERGGKVAEALGLDGANATAVSLRAVPAEKFSALREGGLSNSPVPVGGDPVLPRSIERTFAAGEEARLPLILGATSDDVSVVRAFGFDPATVLKRLGAAGFLVKVLYPGVRDEAEIARQATRDLVFLMPVRGIADRHARRAPTWRYTFDYVGENTRADQPNGVPHGGEIPYTLDTLDLFDGTKGTATNRDRAFARQISDAWLAFARNSRPSAEGLPAWPNHTRASDTTMVFGAESEIRANAMRARLNLYLGVSRLLGTILRTD